jgi:malate/lactate dehydrogenase
VRLPVLANVAPRIAPSGIFAIGMVAARLARVVLRDERVVMPIGSYNSVFATGAPWDRARYGVTLSMPSVLGRTRVERILEPSMSDDERTARGRSAAILNKAVSTLS